MPTESTPASIVIRSYQPGNLAACREIISAAYQSSVSSTAYINHILETDMTDIEKNYLQVPNGHWWVAVSTDNNRVAEHVAGLPLSIANPSYYDELPEDERDQVYELRRMVVANDLQRAGVGSKLLSTLIDFARDKGYRQVHLTTMVRMKKACAFYERSGFKKGRLVKYLFADVLLEKQGNKQEQPRSRPKPANFEPGAVIPDEDLRSMQVSPSESKYIFVQHYSTML